MTVPAPASAYLSRRTSDAKMKSIAHGKLSLGFQEAGRHIIGGAGRESTPDADPFGRHLPMVAEIVTPCGRPSVPGLVGGRSVEAARLMRSKIIEAQRQSVRTPFVTREPKSRVIRHAELVIGLIVRSYDRIAVEILRDERPVSGRLQSRTEA